MNNIGTGIGIAGIWIGVGLVSLGAGVSSIEPVVVSATLATIIIAIFM